MIARLTLDIPADWWMNSNHREHWARHGQKTKHIRQLACLRAKQEHVPTFDVALIYALIQYPRGGRHDPFNAAPTIKAAVDGLVDAGVFADDDSQHVIGPAPVRKPGKSPTGIYRMEFVIVDQEIPW